MGISPSIGAGSWTTSEITSTDQVWNRMTTGGADGNSIHHISLYDPFGGPYPLTGVQSQMLYWRSQDGGTTWDINEAVIPGLDETNFTFFSGDSYHIAKARGDTLALCYFGGLNDVVLAKSTDNGTTWATTTTARRQSRAPIRVGPTPRISSWATSARARSMSKTVAV